MTPKEVLTANKIFLDEAVVAGDEILLAERIIYL